MRISDEELEMLGIRYGANVDNVKGIFATFYEYVLNYQNNNKEVC